MTKLANRINRQELKERMEASDEKRITISFYKYTHIRNPQFFRDYLYHQWTKLNVLGRVYVAGEGINAQVSVPEERYADFRGSLFKVSFLNGIRLNTAVDDDGKSFFVLKIKLRPKILADGLSDQSFDVTDRGQHLKAAEFNRLTDDPETILIDMRNHYETEVGHFAGAITPQVDSFRESLPKIEKHLKGREDKNVVMYCTGGIRCEKASAWFKHRGFKNVYQLEGGIIEYARQTGKEGLDNKFAGKNFVFDERLGERIGDEVISCCHQCGKPADRHTNCANRACHLLFIQCHSCREKYNGTCSEECMKIHALPEEEQKKLRKIKKKEGNIFIKGRSEKLTYRTVHNPLDKALPIKDQD